jgi:endonuclease YncB( thermonuclease family)
VVSAGVLVSGGKEIRLAGIKPLASDARCIDTTGEWPCGAFAKVAFQRLVRQRTIECDPVDGNGAAQIVTACRVAGADMALWLVRQGWATPAGAGLEDALAGAKADGRGQWGARPPAAAQ